MPIQKPTLLQISDTIGINMNQIASFSVDFATETEPDTVSFFYDTPGSTGLSFQVGKHITQEDFQRITDDLASLIYDRSRVSEQTPKRA